MLRLVWAIGWISELGGFYCTSTVHELRILYMQYIS